MSPTTKREAEKEEVTPEVASERTVDLYNANDGIHGRDGGPYLDQEEARHWEKHYAAREGKAPDLEKPRPYPGILLQTSAQQVSNYNPTLIAGDDRRDGSKFEATPVVEEVPVVASVLADFSLTDTEDKGDKNEFELVDPPLDDTPEENNIGLELAKQEK